MELYEFILKEYVYYEERVKCVKEFYEDVFK